MCWLVAGLLGDSILLLVLGDTREVPGWVWLLLEAGDGSWALGILCCIRGEVDRPVCPVYLREGEGDLDFAPACEEYRTTGGEGERE